VAELERLAAADRAAVGRLLLEVYADYAERLGPVEWPPLWRFRLDLAGGR
jgi:hypothetical protein